MQAGIPEGSYLGSCEGCRLEDGGRRLVCTHCGDGAGRRVESSIAAGSCGPDEQLGNLRGRLACEPRSEPVRSGQTAVVEAH